MFKPYCFKTGDECRYKVHEESDLVFVLMPFAEEFDDVYQTIKGLWERLGLRCLRSDEIFHTREIMCVAICQNIQRARFIVADMTGKNPNVFYELGIAHILGKPVVLITQRPEDVPFDLRAMLYVHYGNDDGTASIPKLRRNLSMMARGLLESKRPVLPLPIVASPDDLTRFARVHCLGKRRQGDGAGASGGVPDGHQPGATGRTEAPLWLGPRVDAARDAPELGLRGGFLH